MSSTWNDLVRAYLHETWSGGYGPDCLGLKAVESQMVIHRGVILGVGGADRRPARRQPAPAGVCRSYRRPRGDRLLPGQHPVAAPAFLRILDEGIIQRRGEILKAMHPGWVCAARPEWAALQERGHDFWQFIDVDVYHEAREGLYHVWAGHRCVDPTVHYQWLAVFQGAL